MDLAATAGAGGGPRLNGVALMGGAGGAEGEVMGGGDGPAGWVGAAFGAGRFHEATAEETAEGFGTPGPGRGGGGARELPARSSAMEVAPAVTVGADGTRCIPPVVCAAGDSGDSGEEEADAESPSRVKVTAAGRGGGGGVLRGSGRGEVENDDGRGGAGDGGEAAPTGDDIARTTGDGWGDGDEKLKTPLPATCRNGRLSRGTVPAASAARRVASTSLFSASNFAFVLCALREAPSVLPFCSGPVRTYVFDLRMRTPASFVVESSSGVDATISGARSALRIAAASSARN